MAARHKMTGKGIRQKATRSSVENHSFYLDYNAGAPLLDGVGPAMLAASIAGNPSSQHAFGRRKRVLIDRVRAQVIDFVGAGTAFSGAFSGELPGDSAGDSSKEFSKEFPKEFSGGAAGDSAGESVGESLGGWPANGPGGRVSVIFTSGATEANNLALRGIEADGVLISAVEHDSVYAARDDARIIPVTSDGVIDGPLLDQALARAKGRSLVSVMMANNETGIINNMADIADRVHRHGGILHCDAAQASARVPLSMAKWGVDAMSLSGHKFGAPTGVGALIIAPHVRLRPILRGGGQEGGLRAGTENMASIAGLGAAFRLAKADPKWASWRDAMEDRLLAGPDDVTVFGRNRDRLPQTSCFAVAGISAQTLVIACDLAGFAIGAGSACSSGRMAPSRVLAAMGADEVMAASAVRVSFGTGTTPAALEAFTDALPSIVARIAKADMALSADHGRQKT